MPTPEVLVSDLGGAIGSAYNEAKNQLFVVEFDSAIGKNSANEA
ncbi:MAG: hypothetical protein AAF798_03390 [Bacteroidota bacterium]